MSWRYARAVATPVSSFRTGRTATVPTPVCLVGNHFGRLPTGSRYGSSESTRSAKELVISQAGSYGGRGAGVSPKTCARSVPTVASAPWGGSGASRSGPAPLTLGSDRVSRGSFATRACLPRSRPRAVALARQRRLDPWLRPTALAGAALAPCCWGCRRLLLAESAAAGSPAHSAGSARSVGLAHSGADSRTSGTSRSGMLTEL